uniref:Poly(A)-specific ribonuclease n=1 Tax=Biston betularia TaxID=82595 RepID=A0A173FD15_BISBE|nr:poly(A)-specific ribonuclease [Biston betularia]
MEVVKKNFKETLPQVSASIEKADFLVIDAEFTGIINGRDVLVFDTPAEYYLRLLNGSTQFLLIQFGLCAFYYDEEKKMYMNDTYNFYLFPRGQPGPEKIFMCQSSSLDFLVAQGFDFNKLIRDGISYMTEPIETKLRDNIKERQKTYSKEKDPVNIPDEHKDFIEETCKNVRSFLDDNKSDEMEIDRCNSFVRLLIYQELKLRFKDEIIVETKILENKSRLLKVLRVKLDSDTKSHTTKRIEREWDEFEEAVGFSKVARMISQSEKLVVGHNMLLDVIHTLNHFFQPLTDDYKAFKEFTHCMFPRILDTKYMSSLPPFKEKVNSSVLPHLLQTLSEPPFALPNVGSYEGRGYSLTEAKLHEAGYDAYITGLCFLAMHSHLTRMRGEDTSRPDPNSAVLKPFLNKIFLAKTAHQDSPYMNFDGDDPSPSRDHVFHLTFPKEWMRNDINLLFSPYGPVMTQFVDDTHAWVALTRRDQARHVLRGLAASARVTVRPYHVQKGLKTSRSDDLEQLKRACNMTNVPRSRSQTVATNLPSPRVWSPPRTEKVSRVRANSISSPLQSPTKVTRKRTSSGVFQVDDSESPPPKKSELDQASEEALKKEKFVANGRRKASVTSGDETKEQKIIERFDSDSKINCVSAFKESDSWD